MYHLIMSKSGCLLSSTDFCQDFGMTVSVAQALQTSLILNKTTHLSIGLIVKLFYQKHS